MVSIEAKYTALYAKEDPQIGEFSAGGNEILSPGSLPYADSRRSVGTWMSSMSLIRSSSGGAARERGNNTNREPLNRDVSLNESPHQRTSWEQGRTANDKTTRSQLCQRRARR